MRSSKFITMIAMTMAITAIMLLLKSGVNEKADYHLRSLVTQEDISRICNAAIDNPATNYTAYTEYFKNYSGTIEGLLVPKDSSDAQSLIDYIKDGNIDTVTNYALKRAGPYLVFIAFAVLCFLSWFFYFGCCCRPCWCCKQSEDEGCYRWVSLIIVVTMYVGIVIGCIIGFSYSTKFVAGINGTTCSFLLFYNDVVNGESKSTTPKWVGITSIKNTLTQTSAALDKIAQNFATAFSANSWATTEPQNFENSLVTSFNSFSTQTLDNPNPASSLKGGVTKVIPIYIALYGDYTKSGTALNSIYTEYNTKIKASITLMDQAKTYSTGVNYYMADIKATLSTIQSNVNTMTSGFDQISDTVISSWIQAQDQVNNTGVTAFLVLFAVLISISVISFFFLFFYTMCCKIQCFRFFLHILWNLTTIIMIITFLLGGVFGIIGLVGIDGVPVMKYIFGADNLGSTSPKIITDTKTAKYINICINGNGDLSKEFVPTGSSADYLDKLYNVSYTLSTTKAQIAANKNSQVVTSLNTQYTSMQNDISTSTDPTTGNNHVANILNAFRGWTDSNLNTNQKGCSPSAQDVWVQSKSLCPADFSYAPSGNLGNKNCLVFPESTAAQASSRYSSQTGCAAGNADFSSVSLAVSAYVTALNKYVADNKALLDTLIANNNALDQSFQSMAAKLMTSLDNISGVITPLYDIFNNIVANQGLFSMINCSFMGTDLNMFYDQMQNNLASYSAALGGVIIAVSFMEAISVFFILIVIFRFRDHGKKTNAEPKSS